MSVVELRAPQPGPEPLNVVAPRTQPVISGYVPPMPDRPIPSPVPGAGARASADEGAAGPKVGFSDRWLDPTVTARAAPALVLDPGASSQGGSVLGLGYSTSSIFSPSQLKGMPNWPVRDPRSNQ